MQTNTSVVIREIARKVYGFSDIILTIKVYCETAKYPASVTYLSQECLITKCTEMYSPKYRLDSSCNPTNLSPKIRS